MNTNSPSYRNRHDVLVVVMLLAIVSSGTAQQQQIAPEAIVSIRQADDVQLSPDGRQIAFTVTDAGTGTSPTAQPRSKIWIVATNDHETPHQLKIDLNSASSPRWAPDSRKLAFLSDGATDGRLESTGGTQIYLMDADASSSERLTSTPGGVDEFKWSVDGAMIAFIDRGEGSEGPPQASVDDPIEVDKDAPPPGLWVLTLSNRKAMKVPSLGFSIQNFAWSPDGSEFAVIREGSPSLVVVSRSTGKITRTLAESVGLTSVLQWSPDGRSITFYDAVAGDSSAWWLAVVPAAGGQAKPILKDDQLTILDARWTPDSKYLIAEIIEGTRGSLIGIDVQGGSFRRLTEFVVSQVSFSLSTNGAITAYLNQGPRSPNDVWILLSDGSTRKMSHLNPQVASWNLGDVSEVHWKNTKDGLSLNGILITPPGFRAGQAYPTIVEAHIADCPWWPGWLADWWSWGQLLASHGYVVFLPNTRGVTGRGWKLHRTINDWGGMAFQDLMDGVDELVGKGIADPNRLGIGGWSNGGFMTEYAITHTTRFKAAVAEAGHSDLFSLFGTSPMRTGLLVAFGASPYLNRQRYDESSPMTHARECKTPTLVLHGINDDGVPVSQGYEFHYALKSLGVDTDMVVYPREGHSIDEPGHEVDLQKRVVAWFDRYLRN